MREYHLPLDDPVDRFSDDFAVGRLQFDSAGTRLAGWLGSVSRKSSGPAVWDGCEQVSACDLRSGRARSLSRNTIVGFATGCDPVLSPDFRYLVCGLEDHHGPEADRVWTYDLAPGGRPLPWLGVGGASIRALALSPDGTTLVAGLMTRTAHTRRRDAPELVRVAFDAFVRSPVGVREATNMITGEPELGPDPPWLDLAEPVAALPGRDRVCALSVSADGRTVAAGTAGGAVHVVELTTHRRVRSVPWAGPKRWDGVVRRVAFDPDGRWVYLAAGGRVYATPLNKRSGTAWQTRPALGYVHECAVHPAGHTLAAVTDSGSVLNLDPATGEVRTSFRWGPAVLHSVAFAPDGLTCAAGGEDGRVVLWDVDE